MRLATIRTGDGTRAVRVEGESVVEVGPCDLVELLQDPEWLSRAGAATGPRHALAEVEYAPLVGNPEKIVCVGLNYRNHILEMGRELPRHPTLFAKYARSLIGARDDIVIPAGSASLDWEAELGMVIGQTVRHANADAAAAAIAGYCVINDVTARDWQYRSPQWLQGKTFEATTPVGPWLVTLPERGALPFYQLCCEVDGELVQSANTRDLVFDPVTLVQYISTVITLVPGDLIATGSPGGVGHARQPPRFLQDGSHVVTRIEGIGECRNRCRSEEQR